MEQSSASTDMHQQWVAAKKQRLSDNADADERMAQKERWEALSRDWRDNIANADADADERMAQKERWEALSREWRENNANADADAEERRAQKASSRTRACTIVQANDTARARQAAIANNAAYADKAEVDKWQADSRAMGHVVGLQACLEAGTLSVQARLACLEALTIVIAAYGEV
jgi:hypothetical protein